MCGTAAPRLSPPPPTVTSGILSNLNHPVALFDTETTQLILVLGFVLESPPFDRTLRNVGTRQQSIGIFSANKSKTFEHLIDPP